MHIYTHAIFFKKKKIKNLCPSVLIIVIKRPLSNNRKQKLHLER